MRAPVTTLIAAAVLGLAGCGGGAAPAPRDITPGVDVCADCHMTVDDPLESAQWVESGGRVHTFDEPGCMLRWLGHHDAEGGAGFVADWASGDWIPVDHAWLVRGGSRTDMGYDLVAFAEREAAEARAREAGGEVTTWADLAGENLQPTGSDHDHAR